LLEFLAAASARFQMMAHLPAIAFPRLRPGAIKISRE